MTGGGVEARHGIRLSCSFFSRVEGVDDRTILRTGNLSTTGVYFETSNSVGRVGSLQWLKLKSADKAMGVELLARIIRVMTIVDLEEDRKVGTAFEFLPDSDTAQAALDAFVRHVFAEGVSGDGVDLDLRGSATSEDGKTESAVKVSTLGLKRMVLDMSWRPGAGESLHFDFRVGDRNLRVHGKVATVESRDEGYRVSVEVIGEEERQPEDPEDFTFSGAVEDAFTDIIATRTSATNYSLLAGHLSGSLARIKFPTLLALIEMERLSGVLTVARSGESIHVYASDGRIIDAESSAKDAGEPKSILATLFDGKSGEFDFVVEPCDRPDRIHTSTTGLMLDLACELDEKSR